MNLPLLVVSILTLLVARAAGAQSVAAPGSGSVVVNVMEHTTPAPIEGAEVVLTAVPPGTGRRRSTTFADGSARFENIPAGRYAVSASAVEHLPPPGAAGLDWLSRASVTVQPNEASHIRLTLARAPAIQGTVLLADGQPVRGAAVSLITPEAAWYIARVKDAEQTITDANGRFRMAGLLPGKYRVRVSLDSSTPPRFNDSYWPGSPSLSEAQSLDLTNGDEPTIAIVASRLPTVRVAGRVLDMAGRPVARADITFHTDTRPDVAVRSGDDGTFVVPHLRVAPYDVVARLPGGSVQGPVSGAAVAQIDVGLIDIGNVTLTVKPTSALSGQVFFNGEDRADPGRLVVSAPAHGADARLRSPLVTSSGWHADGAFDLYGLLGRHLIRVSGFPVGWRAEAILLEDGTNLLGVPFDFGSGTTRRHVRVLLTDQVATINVAVTADRLDGTRLTVVAFPEDAGGSDRSGLMRTATVLAGGTVALPGLTPGEVYLVALLRPTTPGPGVLIFPKIDETLLGALVPTAVRVAVPAPAEYAVTLHSRSAVQIR